MLGSPMPSRTFWRQCCAPALLHTLVMSLLCLCSSLGGDRRDQNVHVEKGHCHLSVPKLEVLLDLNNVSSTKDDLAHLLRRVGRRDRKVWPIFQQCLPLFLAAAPGLYFLAHICRQVSALISLYHRTDK